MTPSESSLKFNENLLNKLLGNLQKRRKVDQSLREIADMNLPEEIAKQFRVLEKIEKYRNNPLTERMVAVIRKKVLGADSVSKTPPTTENSAENSPIPFNHNSRLYPFFPLPYFSAQVFTPLQIEIPEDRNDNKCNFISSDLLTEKVPENNNIHCTMSQVQTSQSQNPLNFGPGLQVSEQSAFRPFVSRPKLTIADVYNSPVFQEVYRRVVEEDEALRSCANPTVDQILDEMNMLNAPFFMLRAKRYQQQKAGSVDK